jgi:hypothetical protein
MESQEHFAAVGASCASCVYYQGRRSDPEQQAAAEAAGMPRPRGQCHRYPEIVPKHDSDCCGEHQQLKHTARKILADEIAWAVATAVAATLNQPAKKGP